MQHTLKFCKMHGLGNDFIVIDGVSQQVNVDALPIAQLANRHLGVGFDQLLLIEKTSTADFACRIFNSDGSEAEQCGNGMRCVARFVREHKLADKNVLTIQTKAGVTEVDVSHFDKIKVNMGQPSFESNVALNIADQALALSVLSMGNPHAILQVSSLHHFPISELGHQVSTHDMFPHGVNVGFMEIVNSSNIRLRTYERGAGDTLACGSNSCAAVVAGIQNKLLDNRVKVDLALGSLWIEWAGEGQPVFMTGPAEKVFDGVITKT